MSIKQSMLRIHAFASILQDDIYTSYVLNPYVAINDGDVDLPQVSDNNTTVLTAQ